MEAFQGVFHGFGADEDGDDGVHGKFGTKNEKAHEDDGPVDYHHDAGHGEVLDDALDESGGKDAAAGGGQLAIDDTNADAAGDAAHDGC